MLTSLKNSKFLEEQNTPEHKQHDPEPETVKRLDRPAKYMQELDASHNRSSANEVPLFLK